MTSVALGDTSGLSYLGNSSFYEVKSTVLNQSASPFGLPQIYMNQTKDYTEEGNPRKCIGDFCSMRYVPISDEPLTRETKQRQWEVVSREYSMSVIYQNEKAALGNRAFVTMLMGTNIQYILSNFVLAKSISVQKSSYPKVLLINSDAIEYIRNSVALKAAMDSLYALNQICKIS